MADNLIVKDGAGVNKTLRTKDLGSDVHVPFKALTDSAGVAIDAANPLQVGGTALGAPADAEAAGNGGIIAILKRIRTILGGVLSVSPPATSAFGTGTREYNLAIGTRTAVAAASSAEVALGTLGASREVLINPSVRCFMAFGIAGMGPAVVGAANLVVPADAMLHIRIPAGVTHYRVIRDAATDGFVSVIPVS